MKSPGPTRLTYPNSPAKNSDNQYTLGLTHGHIGGDRKAEVSCPGGVGDGSGQACRWVLA